MNIDGFRFISACRAVARRKSGDVGLFIKKNIWPFIKILESSSENCIWFTFKEYYDIQCVFGLLTFLQRVLRIALLVFLTSLNTMNFCTGEITYTCLMGDFNARSRLLYDFITIDEKIGDSALNF